MKAASNFPPDPARCPLCGGSNACAMAQGASCADDCWCRNETISQALLDSVPASARGISCLCRRCVVEARCAEAQARPLPEPQAGDYYLEGGLVVFTEAYHCRRGYCCGNDCRHCPFDALEMELSGAGGRK